MDADTTYKTTALALQNRRLAKVTKKRGDWSVTLTDAGQHFLIHGAYPAGHWDVPERDQTPGQVAAAARRAATRPPVTGSRPVDQLLTDVMAANGRLVVTTGDRTYWERLVSTAARYGKVPAGKVLRVEPGGSWTENVISLADAPEWMTAVLAPVPVADQLRRPHLVVAEIRDDPDRMNVTRPARQRALRLLDALAKEGVARGYQVRAPRPGPGYGRAKGLLEIEMTGPPLVIDLDEATDRVPHEPTAAELREKQRHSWTRIPTHDQVPSGLLRLRILTGWPVAQEKFADTKTIDLADRLPQVLQELELRAAAQEEQRQLLAKREAERRERWERAVADAKVAAVQHHRAQTLLAQVQRWLDARNLDAYLDAMTRAASSLAGDERAAADEWLDWSHGYRDRLDPLRQGLRMPATPQLGPHDLQPFMGDLSAYGP
jgi:hypothetical protein